MVRKSGVTSSSKDGLSRNMSEKMKPKERPGNNLVRKLSRDDTVTKAKSDNIGYRKLSVEAIYVDMTGKIDTAVKQMAQDNLIKSPDIIRPITPVAFGETAHAHRSTVIDVVLKVEKKMDQSVSKIQ